MKKQLVPLIISALLIGFIITCSIPLEDFSSGESSGKSQPVTIQELQGLGHLSPYVNTWVKEVRGIVTLVGDQGFWMQSSATWEALESGGIYVYTRGETPPEQGDYVSVKGKVQEFGEQSRLTTTEIVFPTVQIIDHNRSLPDPIIIGPKGWTFPGTICDDAPNGVSLSPYDPQNDQIDFWESLEGMMIQLEAPLIEGVAKYNLLPLSLPTADLSQGHKPLIQLSLTNQEETFLSANRGDRIGGVFKGVVDYKWGEFHLIPLGKLTLNKGNRERQEATFLPQDDLLRVASFNLENFSLYGSGHSAAEVDKKLTDLTQTIALSLSAPDIIAVQEVMDDSGTSDNGQVLSWKNFSALSDRLKKSYNLSYLFYSQPPQDKADGGAEGANIRTGFLYNPERITPMGPPVVLNDESFTDCRKPLLGRFLFGEQIINLVNCHLSSKRSDTPFYGEFQPPRKYSEAKRIEQAKALLRFIEERIKKAEGTILLGDINDTPQSPVLQILTEDLVSLTNTLSNEESYTYNYKGRRQQLDHILASPHLSVGTEAEVVHRYSDFSQAYSDHDPLLASIPLTRTLTQGQNLSPPEGGLLFVDYGEGSGYNKYLEVANLSSQKAYLDRYFILYCSNGKSLLEGKVYPFPPGETLPSLGLLGMYNSRAEGFERRGGYLLGASFNGNDQIFLVEDKNGDGLYNGEDKVLDAIGIPGEEEDFASNRGMMRQPYVSKGSTQFDPTQWMNYSSERVDGGTYYGSHFYWGQKLVF